MHKVKRNKPQEIMDESEDNVLSNQQYEKGKKEKTEDIADGINQYSHLSDTTTSMSTSESCYVETSEGKTLSAHINEDGDNMSKRLLCEPCSADNEQVEATHFCKTCDDPDPLCGTCAKYHLRQKLSKDHEMCADIKEFRYREPKERCSDINVQENRKKIEIESLSTPGKPEVLKVLSDAIELFWSASPEVDFYEICYGIKDIEELNIVKTDTAQNKITITGLKANTKYVFKVRKVFQNKRGEYGPASYDVQTSKSPATRLLHPSFSTKVTDADPSKYRLLARELENTRNNEAKTKKVVLGELNTNEDVKEKTIMLVGATGSGKSTLVDGFVNYLMGVNFDDPFRFTILQLEEEERKNNANQALSQTEWITVYKIVPQEGSRINYTINIIDTPGFGDTRGIEKDQRTVDQIRHLFSQTGPGGVLYIDAICFIVKAPDARLTPSQIYIFNSLMALFGRDVESNMCTLITFVDGTTPPVLASLHTAELPTGSIFEFNNSALFAGNRRITKTSVSAMFWEIGLHSFQKFFSHICNLQTKSLSQTKDVLIEREHLKTIILSIHNEIKLGLTKQANLKSEMNELEKHKSDIEDNKNFEIEVPEMKQILVNLDPGTHVTNCIKCNVTCHDNCAYGDDDDKYKCSAMKDGYCEVCKQKCAWTDHKNARCIIEYRMEKVKKTYTKMKEQYQKAEGLKMTHELLVRTLQRNYDVFCEEVKRMMIKMKESKDKLNEIAMKPDPLTNADYLEQMIQAEKFELNREGAKERIQMLEEYKQMALLDKRFQSLSRK